MFQTSLPHLPDPPRDSMYDPCETPPYQRNLMEGVSMKQQVARPIAVGTEQAAAMIGVSPRTLVTWRTKGKGPK